LGTQAINENIDRRTYKTYVIVAQEDCSSDFSTPENERKVEHVLVRFCFLIILGHILLLKHVNKLENAIGHIGDK